MLDIVVRADDVTIKIDGVEFYIFKRFDSLTAHPFATFPNVFFSHCVFSFPIFMEGKERIGW